MPLRGGDQPSALGFLRLQPAQSRSMASGCRPRRFLMRLNELGSRHGIGPARSSRKPVRRHEIARNLRDPRRHNPCGWPARISLPAGRRRSKGADKKPVAAFEPLAMTGEDGPQQRTGQRPAAQSKAGRARLRTGASDNQRAMAGVGGDNRSGPPRLWLGAAPWRMARPLGLLALGTFTLTGRGPAGRSVFRTPATVEDRARSPLVRIAVQSLERLPLNPSASSSGQQNRGDRSPQFV
jgi:hypothetical protein